MIPAVILNIVLIILEIISIVRRPGGFSPKLFVYYTIISNVLAAVSAALFLLTGGSVFSVYLRYLSVCMLIMTVFVTLCILSPMTGEFKKLMLSGSGLFNHTLCPLICVISYVFFEPHVSAWPLPALVTLAYGAVMMAFNAKGTVDGPYPFFRVKKQSATASVLWMAALFAVIAAVSVAVGKLG